MIYEFYFCLFTVVLKLITPWFVLLTSRCKAKAGEITKQNFQPWDGWKCRFGVVTFSTDCIVCEVVPRNDLLGCKHLLRTVDVKISLNKTSSNPRLHWGSGGEERGTPVRDGLCWSHWLFLIFRRIFHGHSLRSDLRSGPNEQPDLMKTVCLYIFWTLHSHIRTAAFTWNEYWRWSVMQCDRWPLPPPPSAPLAGAAPLYKTVTLAHHPPVDLLVYCILWHEAVSCVIPDPYLCHCKNVCRLKQDK